MTELETIFVQLFKKNACNVSVTCHKTGIGRHTYYDWYNKPAKTETDEDGNLIVNENQFKIAIDEAKESLIDFTESALYKQISGISTKTIKIKEILSKDGEVIRLREEQTIMHKPDIAAIIFLLKTLGRKRGWKDTLDMNLNETAGNDITNEMRVAISKLTPEEKKQAIAIGKKLNDG